MTAAMVKMIVAIIQLMERILHHFYYTCYTPAPPIFNIVLGIWVPCVCGGDSRKSCTGDLGGGATTILKCGVGGCAKTHHVCL